MTRMFRQASLACLLLGVSSAALAQTKVVVREFDGPGAKRARAVIVTALSDHDIELVANTQAEQSARAVSADLGTPEGRAQVAAELGVSAFVEGRAGRAGSRTRVSVVVYAGSDGEPLGDELEVTAPRKTFARLAGERFWKTFGAAIQDAPVPVAPAAAPEPTETDALADGEPLEEEPRSRDDAHEDEDEEEDDGSSGDAPSPLDVSLGMRIIKRDFSYSQTRGTLNGYALDPSPSLALRLRWYPAAHVTDSFAANIGLDLRGEMLMFVKTRNSAGDEFSTDSFALGAGLRVRIPLAQHELAVIAGYGTRSFSVESDTNVRPNIPEVTHAFLRLGAEAKYLLAGPISLQLQLAYLLGLSHGQLTAAEWFPHASGGGLELEAGIGLALSQAFELQLMAAMERYFFSLAPEPTDPVVVAAGGVAGGAIDQYLSLRLSLLWRL